MAVLAAGGIFFWQRTGSPRRLADGKGNEAAAEFQKILDRKAANWGVFYPLAYAGLARGVAKAGDTARAKKAYEDLFAPWKDAEPALQSK